MNLGRVPTQQSVPVFSRSIFNLNSVLLCILMETLVAALMVVAQFVWEIAQYTLLAHRRAVTLDVLAVRQVWIALTMAATQGFVTLN
jgi:hypothetical protein